MHGLIPIHHLFMALQHVGSKTWRAGCTMLYLLMEKEEEEGGWRRQMTGKEVQEERRKESRKEAEEKRKKVKEFNRGEEG